MYRHFSISSCAIKLIILCLIFNTIIMLLTMRKLHQPDKVTASKETVDIALDEKQCVIPTVDPYNEDVYEYFDTKYEMKTACRLIDERQTHVNGSNLVIKLRNVSDAKLCYIRRIDDYLVDDMFSCTELNVNNMKDVDLEVPLTEEFIKVAYRQNNKAFEEFHMQVLPSVKEMIQEKKRRAENELDILVIMLDSLSHANAQRQLKSSYKYLNQDENTVIFKGHTINGDGTTAQVTALLTGLSELDLPEARRGIEGANNVDSWPFIFRDYHDRNYITLYSEDDPSLSTFQLRLMGFKEKPTHKYLRPFYQSLPLDMDIACSHRFAFNYLKDFYREFKYSKKFSFFSIGISHNNMNDVRNVDDDLYNTLEHLRRDGHLNHTTVFILGDHGMRAGGYRGTIVGKLEERLPFMSLTLPGWFIKKYTNKFNNLHKNSNILTTHYDIHATLLQFLDIENPKLTNKYGTSLLTDISLLKRTCSEANIASHWCPCVQYDNILTNDSTVHRIVDTTVAYINRLLEHNEYTKTVCRTLTYKDIIKATVGGHTEKLQQFVHTVTTKLCDSRAPKFDSSLPVRKTYEVTFSVLPSNAIFEVTADLVILGSDVSLYIQPFISRIDFYGDQPSCVNVPFPHFRKFCQCK